MRITMVAMDLFILMSVMIELITIVKMAMTTG